MESKLYSYLFMIKGESNLDSNLKYIKIRISTHYNFQIIIYSDFKYIIDELLFEDFNSARVFNIILVERLIKYLREMHDYSGISKERFEWMGLSSYLLPNYQILGTI